MFRRVTWFFLANACALICPWYQPFTKAENAACFVVKQNIRRLSKISLQLSNILHVKKLGPGFSFKKAGREVLWLFKPIMCKSKGVFNN